uniref:Secreted protein n=1 Tax=Anopheles quadriannulatus TaxID=34691 RepID=A0A182XPZ6_ANOQN
MTLPASCFALWPITILMIFGADTVMRNEFCSTRRTSSTSTRIRCRFRCNPGSASTDRVTSTPLDAER